MSNTGITRPLDELGRITIPMEIRKRFDIRPKDPLEIYIDGESIILKKPESEQECYCCNKRKSLVKVHGRGMCKDCIKLFYNSLERMGSCE